MNKKSFRVLILTLAYMLGVLGILASGGGGGGGSSSDDNDDNVVTTTGPKCEIGTSKIGECEI